MNHPGDGRQDRVHGRLGTHQGIQVTLPQGQILSGSRIPGRHHDKVIHAVRLLETIPASVRHIFPPGIDHPGHVELGHQIDQA
jgi:hypothetical protein